MTRDDVVDLLTLAAGWDQRTVGKGDVLAWHLLLEPYTVGDAAEALKEHYRHSTDRAMPAHLINLMDEWRDQWRMGGGQGEKPDGWPVVPQPTISGPEFARRLAERRQRRVLQADYENPGS